jgi:excisionase family DNA binding protein
VCHDSTDADYKEFHMSLEWCIIEVVGKNGNRRKATANETLSDYLSRSAPDTYLSTHEAATRLGVTQRSVVGWLRTGRLKGYQTPGGDKRKGNWRVSERSVRAVMAGR